MYTGKTQVFNLTSPYRDQFNASASLIEQNLFQVNGSGSDAMTPSLLPPPSSMMIMSSYNSLG